MKLGPLDEAYVALKELLKARILSPTTRAVVERTLKVLNREAMRQSILWDPKADGLDPSQRKKA